MKTFTRDQQIALLVVPVLLFGVLGVTYTSASGRNLTDEQKEIVQDAHDLRESGDFESARILLEDAGIGGKHNIGKRHGKKEAIRDAVENSNFDAFMEAVAETPFGEAITEETFEVLVEAHKLHEIGNHESARELLNNERIKRPMMKERGHQRNHHQDT